MKDKNACFASNSSQIVKRTLNMYKPGVYMLCVAWNNLKAVNAAIIAKYFRDWSAFECYWTYLTEIH